MATSIFDIEVRIDINKEFHKMVKHLYGVGRTTIATGYKYSFFDAINNYAF